MVSLSWFIDQLLTFLAFAASLVVPLFLIPELLLRRGMREWKTRVIGWAVFTVVVLTLAITIGRWQPSVIDLLRWEVYGGLGAILLAAWWDVRRARRKPREVVTQQQKKP